MADNVLITQGSGTTIAADDIGGVLHQRVKLSQGADGSATDVSSAAPLHVTLANTGANATAVKVDGSAVTQPISAASLPLPSLAATSTKQSDGSQKTQIVDGSGNVIGATSNALDVNIKSGASSGTQYREGDTDASITGTAMMFETNTGTSALGVVSANNPLPISDNESSITVDGTVAVSGTVTVGSHAVTNAGTFAVQENGAALTALQLIDDTIATTASAIPGKGVAISGTDGTNARVIKTDSAGELQVDVLTMPTTTVTGTVTANAGTGTMAVSNTTLSVVGGGTEASALRVTFANDSTGVISVDDNGGSLTVDGTVSATQSGTWTLGANSGVDVGDVTINNASGGSAVNIQDGGNSITVDGTVSATSTGDVAHDSADSGNPVKVGGKAVSSEPTAVANADRANLITDLVGKLITLPYANPENFVSGAITSSMTGTTSTSLVAAPGSGLRNYITTIIVSNAHATVGTDVAIQDGSGGTTLLTIPAAAVYGGAVINLPVPLRQPTTNTALFCANVTTGASTKVSAVGYKGV